METPFPRLHVGSTCPDENVLQRYVEHGLNSSVAAEVVAHSEQCERCRQVLAALGESAVSLPPVEPPRSRLGRYLLLERVGSGATGVVYAAFDPELDRRVALKLMRGDAGSAFRGELLERLRREAKALARVNHPNVVAVHDVGVEDAQIYITEEFVRGSNLETWLRASGRSPAEVMQMFQQAGRGLAAAHAVGLVHRDFKPANVLVGDDGRVRVVDFGMARSDAGPGEALSTAPSPPDVDALADTALPARPGSPLTRTGTVLGTPLYMSPEQHQARPADARSDQFSFCVSLHEALCAEHPFAGATYGELARATLSGEVRAPPKGVKMPPRWRDALLRGLRPRPEDRFPSMDALLDELARDPRAVQRRRLLIGAGIVAGVAVLAAGSFAAQRRRQLCSGGEAKLSGVWDAPRAATARTAFQRTGVSYAEAAWGNAQAMLDDYAHGWAAMHAEACEATRLRGEQSEEVLDLRMSCLSERLQGLDATVGLLASADAKTVQRSAALAGALPPLATCADVEALKAPLRPPADAATRAKVEQIRAQLAAGRALNETARYTEAKTVADAALQSARAVGYGPLVAEALELVGALEQRSRSDAAAEKAYEEAFTEGVASRADAVAEKVSARLVSQVGIDQGRHADGHRWARIARALLQRGASAALDPGGLQYSEGNLFLDEGLFEPALQQYRQSLALREKALPQRHPAIARTHNSVGRALWSLGRYDEALVEYRTALAMQEQLVPGHPDLAATHNNIGIVLTDQHKLDDALAELWKAEGIYEKAGGKDHPDVALALNNLADVLEKQQKLGEALELLDRAQAIWVKKLGPEHPHVMDGIYNIAVLHQEMGQLPLAKEELERALAMQQKVLGEDHPDLVDTTGSLGEVLCSLGQRQRGEELLRKAIGKIEGQASRQASLAQFRLSLAGAVWEDGRNRPEAVRLAKQAREDVARTAKGEEQRALVDAWLKAHPLRN
jgi:tetratricopeptide (TPR) repeat protein